MTADPAVTATTASVTPAVQAQQGRPGLLLRAEQPDPAQRSWLVQPQVLYGVTSQAAATVTAAQRLDERLRDELRRVMGSLSGDLDRTALTALGGVHWQGVADRPVAEVAGAVLAEASENPQLAPEAAAARARVTATPSATVAAALHLNAPVIDNPALHADVARGLAAEFARLSGLSDQATQFVLMHSEALVNSTAATLDALTAQGSLTSQEQARLAAVLALARLTDDNLALIGALQASGVTSPLPLVGWTAEDWQQLITGQQIPVPPGDTPASYAQTIAHNLQAAYPAHALAAHSGDNDLTMLLARNPGLELPQADLAGGAAAQLDWAGIPAEARGRVEQELRSYQRLIPLADSTADRLALKRAGYDSALAIAGQPEEEFVRTSGVDEARARLIYARAQNAALSVANHHAGLHDLLKTGFTNLPAANTAPLADQLRQIEGMNELFGSQDFCDCDDCHSVLSPAAYFVDLMHFVDHNVSHPVFIKGGHPDHPLHLKRRRPDLWTLPLSPANTTTLIPYITIVNEVLETYLSQAGHGDIYRLLTDPGLTVSFRVPFTLPAAELSLYLGHFGLTPAGIYQALGLPDAQVRQAQLGLSPAEAAVITTPDPAGAPARLGRPGGLGDLDVQDFLRPTGLQRDQLDALLASRFHPDLGAVTITSRADPGELQNIPQILANLTPARLDFLHRLTRFWRASPWQIADLDLLLAAARDARLIGRDLDDRAIEVTARLATLQGQLRLQAEELCALIGDMPVSPGYPSPAPTAERRLYERVFDLPKLFASPAPADAAGPAKGAQQPAPPPSEFVFHHAAFNTDRTDTSTDPSTPLLLSALGVSDADLEVLLRLLAGELAFDASGNCTLDRHRLSLLYRHARLAAATQLPVRDFTQVLQLLFDPAEQVLTTLDQVEQVTAFATWLRGSPFSLADLRFILAAAQDGAVKFSTTADSTAQLVQQVQQVQATRAPDARDALRSRLAAAFNLPTARLASLLTWIPADIDGPVIKAALATSFAADGTPAAPSDLIPLTELGQQLERATLLFSKAKIGDDALAYLTGNPGALGITNPRSVQLQDVQAIPLYAAMINESGDATTVIQAALTGPPTEADQPAADRSLAQLWHVDRILISSLRKILPLARAPLDRLRHLHEAARLCTTLGVNAYSLAALGKNSSYDELIRARDIALGAVSAKYTDAAERDKVLQPLQDRVNVLKRDALCDYILASHAQLGFGSRSDIYDFFLLDPDMGGCFRTSRVVSAISALQTYVQRCRQDLEQTRPGAPVPEIRVPPSCIRAGEWEWRKNFRLWQANRKVFLFPESYLDPGLLDIKTPLFEDLENDLLQQKITMESATDAYQRYLTQFAELAHLRIAGSYYDSATHTYYFFGRTHQDPPVYYWRTWDGTTWSPWRKIDLAIDALTVAAEIHLGHLYLFWVDTKCKDKTTIKDGNSQLEYYEVTISLQYSALKHDGKWLPPQKLDELRPRRSGPTGQHVVHAAGHQTGHGAGAAAGAAAAATVWNNRLVGPFADFRLAEMELSKTYRRVYPAAIGDSLILRYYNGYLPLPALFDRELDLFHNKLRASAAAIPSLPAPAAVQLYPSGTSARLGVSPNFSPSEPEFDLALELLPQGTHTVMVPPPAGPNIYLTEPFPHHPAAADEQRNDYILNLVHNRHPEAVLSFGGQQYLIQQTPAASIPAHHQPRIPHTSAARPPAQPPSSARPGTPAAARRPSPAHSTTAIGHQPGPLYSPHGRHITEPAEPNARRYSRQAQRSQAQHATSITHAAQANAATSHWQMVRLSTSTADDLGETLMRDGLEKLFDLETQRMREKPIGFKIISPAELQYPHDDPDHLNFTGAMGAYYRELYLHVPWLIANALRADGKYEDALWWYRKIFDPTAEDGTPAERCWRYIEFRDLTLPKLQAMLTDPAALAAYEDDPFSPHAIARLRPTAYQRAAVMATIGALLDMGDALFTQDTMESVTEAGMVYNLAAELLGPRPARLGKCRTVPDADLTYEKLGPAFAKGSDMLLMLENWAYVNHAAAARAKDQHALAVHNGSGPGGTVNLPAAQQALQPPGSAPTGQSPPVTTSAYAGVAHYTATAAAQNQATALQASVHNGSTAVPVRHSPALPTLLHSTMAFCIPPNDTLLGLYDQVADRLFKIRNCLNISGVRRDLALFAPPIDVMALVRARAAGLSLEEAMAALEEPVPAYRFSYLIDRARQAAQTVQSFGGALLSALEKKDIEELTLLRSLHERNVLRMTEKVKTDQRDEAGHQLQALIETETNICHRIDYYNNLIANGLTGWEVTQQISRHIATITHGVSAVVQLVAAFSLMIPQGGSPFAMTYGGIQLGNSVSAFAATAETLATVAEAISASAGLEATFQRRDQEWHQQLLVAQQELKQTTQQRLAAELRAAIAEKELDIHQTTMDQADELDRFYKDKFTSLGLYNYLATTLTRLHREAYNTAAGLARMAQRAYAFERDDDTPFIAADNWQADRNGLLAGEKLTMQLHQLETAYLRTNTRQPEVSQSFSLALLDPGALLTFRETGSCEFTIPEILFNLAYPGHYKRIIKSARISIPSVVGPYTTVSAKLTLKDSKVRNQPTTDASALVTLPAPPTPSIATSTATNDAGVFELSFRDERYLPFEGAGAISSWRLELPNQLRQFDYNTISDIILHLSYTARDDATLRTSVETAIVDSLTTYATTAGMHRLFSLRHEFPDAFYQLMNPIGGAQQTQFDLGTQHFPYFLSSRTLTVARASLFIQPSGQTAADTTGLKITVNGTQAASWTTPANTNLSTTDAAVSGPVLTSWTINITDGHLDPDTVGDILILIRYSVA